MGVNLNFGVTGYVAVKDRNDRELYRQPIQSKQEMDQWINAHKASVKGWDFIEASIIPLSVDNFDDLKKDLFLPTFVNHAAKINNLFLKVIASIIAIAWDVLTFPVRLIALPFRVCAAKPVMPVEKLINTNPHFAEAKKDGIVRLVAHVTNVRVTETFGQTHPEVTDQRVRDLPFRAEEESNDVSCEVYLKALPRSQREYLSGGGEWKAYQRVFPSGLWNQYNGLTNALLRGEPVSP